MKTNAIYVHTTIISCLYMYETPFMMTYDHLQSTTIPPFLLPKINK